MKSKLVASKILIENNNKKIWIHITVQQIIYKDGEIYNIIPDYDRFSKPFSKIMLLEYPFTPKKQNTILGYEVYTIIAKVVIEWFKERYDVTEDKDGALWLS